MSRIYSDAEIKEFHQRLYWWMPNRTFSKELNAGKRPLVFRAIIRESIKYDRCIMSRPKLADVAMCTRSTVDAAIKVAVAANLMTVEDGVIRLDPAWLRHLKAYAADHRQQYREFCAY
jgi:hypothetical protein